MPRLVLPVVVTLLLATQVNAAPAKARLMTATAYCQTGRTASGRPVASGMVAADPRILPSGTVIHIASSLARYSGTYRVEDTGGAVKGRIIDIYIPDCREAKRFGRRKVTVEVVAAGPDAQLAAKTD